MVRNLHAQFSEEEWQRMKAGKGDRTWREALLDDLAADEDAVELEGEA